jgi:hypothetical protein
MPAKKSAERDNAAKSESASKLIDTRIKELADWRGEMLSRVRRLIRQADPEVIEEWKWRGVPVWSHDGIICTGETYKDIVKLTFAKGASLEDPAGLFNSSLEGNVRRAIDIHEGEEIDESAFMSLVRAAAALNASRQTAGKSRPKAATRKDERSTATKSKDTGVATKPKLLSGGNPQIAKGEGDAPVQAYIASMPGWKSDVGRRLDALITRNVPNVHKAVKWNSPFYGIKGQGWFLAFHVFARYVKVTFFRGTSLEPIPPGASKTPDTRYLDIYEDDQLDTELVASWIRQASKLPGWITSDIGGS